MPTAWLSIAEQSLPSYERFVHGCAHLRSSQETLLHTVLLENADSEFGKQHGFKQIAQSKNPTQAFQNQVPISNYDSIESSIQTQMAGAKSLTSSQVLFYERTGGSSGGCKYIPYTQSALQLLQEGVEPWLYDLIQSRPHLKDASAYWSISPAMAQQETSTDGTRIGAESDLAFLRQELQAAFVATMVNPEVIQRAQNFQQWQQFTLLTLLMHEHLQIISIWSPSFLTTLLSSFDQHTPWLINALNNPEDIELGSISWLQNPEHNKNAIQRLEAALHSKDKGQALNTATLWPQLDTISCWTHGPASGSAHELRNWFPEVTIQAKGLLATEAVITVPLQQAAFPVLAVNSGFYEFVDADNHVVLPEQLVNGCIYRVLITNASGLYRYDIGDQVQMNGKFQQAPLLEFIGRSNNFSDLVGEKLTEAFVSQCLSQEFGVSLLAPQGNRYSLFCDTNSLANTAHSNSSDMNLAEQLELRLCKNPQYHYARNVGQLKAVQVCRVSDLAKHYIDWQSNNGQLLGDIKPQSLCTDAALISHLDKLSQ